MCIMCDNEEGLCYLHKKYKAGLSGPVFDKIWDYAYFDETFAKTWKEKVGSKLNICLKESIENKTQDVKHIRNKVRELLENKNETIVWDFIPLVKNIINKFSIKDKDYLNDLFQEGCLALAVVDKRINFNKDLRSIRSYIKNFVYFRLISYIKIKNQMLFVELNLDRVIDKSNPEEAIIKKEKQLKLYESIQNLLRRESVIEKDIINMHLFNDSSSKQIADKHSVHVSTINRKKKKILEEIICDRNIQ